MLFSDDEIKPLEFFKSVAIKLNRCAIIAEKVKTKNFDGAIQTNYGPINFDVFFYELKSLFIEVDLIFKNQLKSSVNEDVYKEFKGVISDLDFNITKNLENSFNFSFENLLMDLYNFFNFFLNKKSKYLEIFDFSNLSFNSKKFYNSFFKLIHKKTFDDSDRNRELIFKINSFEKKIKEFSNRSDNNISEFKKELENFFSNQRVVFDQRVNETINLFNADIAKIQNNYKNDLIEKVDELHAQVSNSKNEVNNLDQAIESYKSTVSTKIQNEISKHYQKKAKMEMITYWGATTFSIILILSSLGLLAWGLVDYYHDYISTNVCLKDEAFNACVSRLEKVRDITKNIGITFFVMRFSFSLLLFLTVIYTSRIAIRAYSHWRHSENMHLKLSSLEPFITELPKEVRHEIHRDLIPDYFGKDAGLVDSTNEKFKDLPANVSAVAMKAIEQISGNSNSSGTEKNGKKSEGGTA
ncbi:hypothetical protein ACOUXA_17495 [Acinetobacter baumannii]|nr:hypothetical protein [Acinetobacter baumannii]